MSIYVMLYVALRRLKWRGEHTINNNNNKNNDAGSAGGVARGWGRVEGVDVGTKAAPKIKM